MNENRMRTSPSNKLFLCAAALAMGILGGTKLHAQPAVEAWVQRYNGPTGASDQAGKVAVDSSDNVIVAGNSGSSWVVIKYSSSGVPIWIAGPAKYGDGAHTLAVDNSGNVVVTGSGGYTENATVKYSSMGVPLWTNRWTSTYYNEPYAVAVDGSGNVFVTGSATIKYSSAGVPLWTNRFGGGGKALAVESNGDVVVTGTIYAGGPNYPNNYDYTTIKYS